MKKSTHKSWIWWKHGVIYHIYPRSFFDANNDGIGDLKGIIEKLDYIEELGVDAIWLSPVFVSPQVDFGYDVSDYRSIDPIFGSMADFRILLKEAHKRNIRIIMDLILNHTSDKHSWFIEASSSIDNPKRKWYLWRNGIGKNPPNNWKTSFGESAWEYNKETNQYYYHSFFKEQPDLNWRNKSLKKEMFDTVEYWLKIGVDGFRLDVANFIVKDKKLRNNPSLLLQIFRGKKVYTRNRPRSIKTIKELRTIIDKYEDRMLVGEIYSLPPGDSNLAAKYLGNGSNALHLAFDFSLIFTTWNAQKYARVIQQWYEKIPARGWACNVLSNHDLHRNFNRFSFGMFKKKKAILSAFLILTMKGTPFIYYGEELGMPNVRLPRKKILDPLGRKFWPFYRGRDGARSPMQWNQNKYAGFTKGRPWLPIHHNYKNVNVEIQKNSNTSIYFYYLNLIKLRKANKILYSGSFKIIDTGRLGVLSYRRSLKRSSFVIVLNFKPHKQKIRFKKANVLHVIFSTHRKADDLILADSFKLFPFEASIFRESKSQN